MAKQTDLDRVFIGWGQVQSLFSSTIPNLLARLIRVRDSVRQGSGRQAS